MVKCFSHSRVEGESEPSAWFPKIRVAAQLEADDADALARAFVAHGHEKHSWSFPEDAIRNYARNYAEATERLTGGTQRLSEIADVTVYPVTEARVDDWLRFVRSDALRR